MLNRNLDCSQTIFALTTGGLPSAVAIVKLSGLDAFTIARRIFFPSNGESFERKAATCFGDVKDLEGRKIDTCLVLTFVAPKSHTGEDTVEFHLHGSIAIVQRVEHQLLELGARPAEKGEFSYRALLNGKVTAEELDTLGDVFAAREAHDLNQIHLRRDGSLQRKVGEIRSVLLRLQAILDTAVDFADEYSSVVAFAKEPLTLATQQISEIIQRYSVFRHSRQVPKLVLAGLPNAGKSSLFNALLCQYRAIVHEEAGTTRDVIEEWLEIEGKTWKLVDTAGVREARAETERQGIEMGEAFLSSASFWILVVDGTKGLSSIEAGLLDRYGRKPHLVVWNKSDLPSWSSPNDPLIRDEAISISAKEGANFDSLWAALKAELKKIQSLDGVPLATQTECARLKNVLQLLEEISVELAQEQLPEYLAEKNRQAIARLESVIGQVEVDDVLDRVFGEFCIGK